MTLRRALGLGVLVLVVAAVWVAVAATSADDDDASPPDRPGRLLDLRPEDVTAVEANGRPVELAQVRADLAPLLAVRTLTGIQPGYGLDPPAVVVTVHTRHRTYDLRIGSYNFDETAVYASVGTNVGTILPTLAERLASAAGVSIPNVRSEPPS